MSDIFDAEIRKDVPVPPARSLNRGAPTKVTALHKMEVGDSIMLECPDKRMTKSWLSRVTRGAHYFGKQLDRKFAVRKLSKDSERLKVGVWRVE